MKVQWFEDDITIAQIEALTGSKVKSLTKGLIETGEFYDTFLEGGGINKIPVTTKGIQIEFEGELTAINLEPLDRVLLSYKRQGGKTIVDELKKLSAKVASLETNMAKLKIKML